MRTIPVVFAIIVRLVCGISAVAQTSEPVALRQVAELTASDGATQDDLGFSVAMSGDTVVAGAPDAPQGNGPGKAYVFVRPATGWTNATQTAELTPSDGVPGLTFGLFVTISGNTIAVYAGASHQIGGQPAVYVFVEPVGGWTSMTETAKLTLPTGSGGSTVAMSGNILAVSGIGFNLDQGEVYIFAKPKSGWRSGLKPLAILTASDGQPDDFLGSSLSLSGDTLAASAPDKGVYVFVKPSSGWENGTETAKLTELDGTGSDAFGSSVAISGGTIIVGAPEAGFQRNKDYGVAYLYYRPANGWTNANQDSRIIPSDSGALDFFGASVAASGGILAVGAYGNVNGGTGAAYVFTGIHEVAELTPVGGMSGEGMGAAVAASGNTVASGASNAFIGSNANQGALYVFAP